MHIEEGAWILVEKWLQIVHGETVFFITDETKMKEAEVFLAAVSEKGAVPELIVLPYGTVQAGESVRRLHALTKKADVVVGATSFSFITTEVVNAILRSGARFLSIPMATNNGESLLEQDFLAMDPQKAAILGGPALPILKKADTIRVTTDLGTDLFLDIKGRRPGMFFGRAAEKGVCASASFEVYIPPVETKTRGRLVLDGSMGYIGLVKKPLELEFENGYLTKIADTADGRRLREYLEHFEDPEMYCAAEFGIGLNTCSRCRGASYIEDESAYGTFHIGFGRNLALGGSHGAKGHFDLVTHRPTIEAGSRMIMRDGEFCRSGADAKEQSGDVS